MTQGTQAGSSSSPVKLSIVGAPFSGGQPKGGVDEGPKRLREAGVASVIKELGFTIQYDQDVAVGKAPAQVERFGKGDNALKNPTFVGTTCKQIFEAVDQRCAAGDFVLTLGGDHSIAAGTILAILKNQPDTCVIWIDAHADINTVESTGSGNIHGMPVAFAMGDVKGVPGFEWADALQNKLPADRIAYIGLRDVDEGEKAILRRHKITVFTMRDVDEFGIAAVIKKAIAAVNPQRDRPIHLSFDIDALDPASAPATGTSVPGGLTLREGRFLCEEIAQTRLLRSMDLTEVNPTLSDDRGRQITLESALILVKAALGYTQK